VENKVGYGRRNWCVPPPVIETPEQFEVYLAQAVETDMDQDHYAKKERIVDLWAQEREKLRLLPTTPLEVVRLEPRRLNNFRWHAFSVTAVFGFATGVTQGQVGHD